MVVGGGGYTPAQSSAESIELTAQARAWKVIGSMAYGRQHMNATLLPDGKLLATGGSAAANSYYPMTDYVLPAELYDPETDSWTTLASMAFPRLYHSTALLLPDGRVLSAGGGQGGTNHDYRSAEVFSPPYLFKGPRPTFTGVANNSVVHYGASLMAQTPDAASITRVTWIRLPSVTHSFNSNQGTYINPPGTVTMHYSGSTPDGLTITPPPSSNLCPPGHYMLFLVNGNGVPSVAQIVQLSN